MIPSGTTQTGLPSASATACCAIRAAPVLTCSTCVKSWLLPSGKIPIGSPLAKFSAATLSDSTLRRTDDLSSDARYAGIIPTERNSAPSTLPSNRGALAMNRTGRWVAMPISTGSISELGWFAM